MTSSAQNSRSARWPSADVLTRATFNDEGPIRFVDTDAAAKYLALDAGVLSVSRYRTSVL